MYSIINRWAKAIPVIFILCGCSAKQMESKSFYNSGLRECPTSPNCVSSEAGDERHKIAPFILKGDPKVNWSVILSVVDSLPRTKVIEARDDYIHAECRSRIFRFVDDLELLLNRSDGIIHVRSASRVGRSDFGVNRNRVESLRKKLKAKEVIE